MSTAFTTKKAAQAWIAANLDDPHSSATEHDSTDDSSTDDESLAVPHRARGLSNVVPPPAVAPAAPLNPFEFITRDSSEVNKDEIFGIGMKKEAALFAALAPRGSSKKTMKALSECITDGTALPGTYAGADDALLEEDDGEIGNMQLAETLSVALNTTRDRHKVVDTTWKTRRISLKSVKSVEDLQTLERSLSHAIADAIENMELALERSLGHAIADAIENMELAFGSVLEKFQWTTEQHDQYFTGGLLPSSESARCGSMPIWSASWPAARGPMDGNAPSWTSSTFTTSSTGFAATPPAGSCSFAARMFAFVRKRRRTFTAWTVTLRISPHSTVAWTSLLGPRSRLAANASSLPSTSAAALRALSRASLKPKRA
jgi:hypothetical protein